ncbi:glycosyltransferase family 4 protein [Kocuria flava]|uniref:glycosyltransferase n=1 Tax=Kocuria flava TaxID=446860 RepID=UPI001FF32D3B|nr:glycosyltransferase [Kocuria flava]MCJ8505909.1 glycosyltransferase family 4 protein [Kocuria flava]
MSVAPRVATTTAVLVTAAEPEPRSFGKQVVMGGLLDHLCSRLGPDNVDVVLIGRAGIDRPATPYRIHLVPKPTAQEQARAVLRRVLLPPRSSLQEAALWSPRVRAEVGRLLRELQPDLEIWDTMRTGQYARDLPRRARVLYADDLFSKRYASMLQRIERDRSRMHNPLGEFAKMLPGPAARVAAHPLVYRRLLRFEEKRTARTEDLAPQQFDATLLVNADETTELARRTGSRSIRTVLPLLPDPQRAPRRFDGTPTFVFLGGLDFPPNRDGLVWFLENCRDEVLTALPDFTLLVVGRGAERLPPEAEPWEEHVRPLGWVDDLDDVLLSAAALLSPLRIGSGTKIKVLEALSRGLPVVATPHGVLGLDVGRSDGCLIGTTPTEIAESLAETVDAGPNRTLSSAAQTSWRRRFAPPVVMAAYDEALNLPPCSAPSDPA